MFRSAPPEKTVVQRLRSVGYTNRRKIQMKRVGIFTIVGLLVMSTLGCACGYRTCGSNYGCNGFVANRVVDYVDGPIGGGIAECGDGCYTDCGPCDATSVCSSPCGIASCGSANCHSCAPYLENSLRTIGRGALTVVAAPFIVVGQIFNGGNGCGYETYPNCGCSNEIYYGDNCLQCHDFCDPCGNVSACGCGGSAANSGCSRCSGGYVEGIHFEGETEIETINDGANYYRNVPQNKVVMRNGRQVTLRQPVQVTQNSANQTKRLTVPPRPVVVAENQGTIISAK